MSDYETLLFEYRSGVGIVTLNRPDRLNSFNDAMHADLARVFDFMEAQPDLRGVVLTGAGRGFSAGQDQQERPPLPEGQTRDMGAALERFYRPLILRMRALPVPIVAIVNGVAAGSGVSVALACDVVIAVESARFIQAFSKLGLMPDAGSTYFMPRLIGTARAMGASLFGDAIGARQAESWGLIWQCIPDDELSATLDTVVRRLANGPTRAFGATKQAILASGGNTLDLQFDVERDLQRSLGLTDDYREGVASFTEKRRPVFKGA